MDIIFILGYLISGLICFGLYLYYMAYYKHISLNEDDEKTLFKIFLFCVLASPLAYLLGSIFLIFKNIR